MLTHTKSSDTRRLPEAFRKSLRTYSDRRRVASIVHSKKLATVCEEAKCPNIGECYANNTATFMILGDRCTRRCKFCAVTTKKPLPPDNQEPMHVADAAAEMGLSYVVITSVDRDDLADYGALHFVRVVMAVKSRLPQAQIELLVPDFKGRLDFVDMILQSPIDVFGHNIETVDRLYHQIRPQSDLSVTKNVLAHASKSGITTKSGMMVGLGENDDEVCETLSMLADMGVSIVTIGQYLRPSLRHWPVERFVSAPSYERFVAHGGKLGIKHVFAGPFVRSSYHAQEAKKAHDIFDLGHPADSQAMPG